MVPSLKRRTGSPRIPAAARRYCETNFLRTRLLVLDLGELGIDDVAVVLLRLASLGLFPGSVFLGSGSGGLLALGVHLLAEFLRGLPERLRLGVDVGLVVRFHHAFGFLDGRFDLFLLAGLQLVAVVGERLL